MIKDFTLYVPKNFVKGFGGFIFNIVVFVLLAALVIGAIIAFFVLLYRFELKALAISRILFALLMIAPPLVMFFNIGESKFLMWSGLILTVYNLIVFLIIPKGIDLYDRKGKR